MKWKLSKRQKRYLRVKRMIDLILAGGASIVLAPFLVLLAFVIKLDSKGPILFKQKRVGKDGEYFEIWKFRTMRSDTPQNVPTHMLRDPDQYITRVGKFLRKTSLDELPQLYNIVKGDMSIVGPRPALWNQYDLIAKREKYGANSITPGLTGFAQVHGRDELEIGEKAKLDGIYTKNVSFRMDLYCFLRTIISVWKQDGVKEGKQDSIKEKV